MLPIPATLVHLFHQWFHQFSHSKYLKLPRIGLLLLNTITRRASLHFCRSSQWSWSSLQLWKLNVEEILSLFSELGFRTLANRVEQLFGEEEPELEPETIDPTELKEVALKLWILESETTNPTLEDIFAYARLSTGKPTFEEAM